MSFILKATEPFTKDEVTKLIAENSSVLDEQLELIGNSLGTRTEKWCDLVGIGNDKRGIAAKLRHGVPQPVVLDRNAARVVVQEVPDRLGLRQDQPAFGRLLVDGHNEHGKPARGYEVGGNARHAQIFRGSGLDEGQRCGNSRPPARSLRNCTGTGSQDPRRAYRVEPL